VLQVAFWVEAAFQTGVLLVLVQVRQFLCTSSMSADSMQCHFSMEGSRLFDIYKPLPGVFYSRYHLFVPRKLNSSLFFSQT